MGAQCRVQLAPSLPFICTDFLTYWDTLGKSKLNDFNFNLDTSFFGVETTATLLVKKVGTSLRERYRQS